MICLAGVLTSGGALAQPALDLAGAAQCASYGYGTDRDPKGTNVRAAPRVTGAIVGRLPPRAGLELDKQTVVGPEFAIIGSKDGWLLIKYISIDQTKTLQGWVSGRLVGGTVGSTKLMATPDEEGKVVATLTGQLKDGSGYGPYNFEIMQIHGCRQRFVDVTVRLLPAIKPPPDKAKPLRGWANRVCSTQLTTCDPG
jgi:hypothetical protein